MRQSLLRVLLLAGLSCTAAAADATTGASTTPITLDTVTVSGILPGPGLWKVSKGEHTLWIFGTLSPLPKRMDWESLPVERVLARSQELILPPGVSVTADIGFFGMMMLAPKALGARKLPDNGELRALLPADLYARWLPLKARYLGSNRGIERWRPLFAADKLYDEALDEHGLRRSSDVVTLLRKRAKKSELTITSPSVTLTIANPKAALQSFRESKLDDTRCFDTTLTRVESDLDNMRARANAWAIGDVATLQALPYVDQNDACVQALMETQVAGELGFAKLAGQVKDKWLAAAEKALATNTSSVAIVAIDDLLPDTGYLAALQARGYTVEAPQ